MNELESLQVTTLDTNNASISAHKARKGKRLSRIDTQYIYNTVNKHVFNMNVRLSTVFFITKGANI